MTQIFFLAVYFSIADFEDLTKPEQQLAGTLEKS
jgi:hypothetical protein